MDDYAGYGEILENLSTERDDLRFALAEALDAVVWLTGLGDLSESKAWPVIRDEQMPRWRALLGAASAAAVQPSLTPDQETP